ncbi:hypothetical protein [Thiocapsa sp. N5-Cardenillas]|uniref:hypothetical protein n=1 Tax=Thiocapsa sp. N5-Cardenillas TaxID=3137397 RepID=UPI0035B1B3FC
MSGPDAAEAIPLFGRTRSLDDIKHGMIRAKGVYDEPRIHFGDGRAALGLIADL